MVAVPRFHDHQNRPDVGNVGGFERRCPQASARVYAAKNCVAGAGNVNRLINFHERGCV